MSWPVVSAPPSRAGCVFKLEQVRCWLCVVAARRGAQRARKREKKLLYPIMIQGGPNNQYAQFLEMHGAREGFKEKIVLAPFLILARRRRPPARPRVCSAL